MTFNRGIDRLINLLNLRERILRANYIEKGTSVGKSTELVGATITGHVSIGEHCRIYKSELHGEITLGRYTTLWGPNINLHAGLHSISIGNFCSIARDVTIQEYNHNHQNFTTYFIQQNLLKSGTWDREVVSRGPIEIDHDVWIGTKATILSGSHLSTGVVVGAGSVVRGFVPPYAIVAGVPARIVKYRFEEEVRNRLLKTEWWLWERERLEKSISELKSLVDNDK